MCRDILAIVDRLDRLVVAARIERQLPDQLALGRLVSACAIAADQLIDTDLGNEIVFVLVRESGRPAGSPAHSQAHDVYGFVSVWRDRKVARVPVYTEPREASAAAERPAESRGRRCRKLRT
jgi:hypothetical protein